MSDSETTTMNKISKSTSVIYGIIQNSLLNNIVLLAIMLIIYLYISADKAQGFAYADIFQFMNILVNPGPCKKKPVEPPTNAPDKGPTVGGGSVADNLSDVASSVKNVGNLFNSLTSNAKKDVDHDIYINETVNTFKETYCNDMDTMGAMGAFFYTMHSSFLSSYNAIQFMNTAIIRLIELKLFDPRYYFGIFMLYIVFIVFSLTISSFVTYITNLIDPTMVASRSFAGQIIYSILSAFVTIFVLYFIVAIVAYLTFLSYALINIKSEQSEMIFKITIFSFLILIPIITFPTIFGVSVI